MAYDLSKVVVTSSPHIKADDDTRSLMLDVLIALVPALAVAVYTFGARALIHVVIAMVASLVFETIYNKIVHHPNTVGDLSCLVTGVLIAFNIPVAAPLWLSAFGALFGIIVVKMLFGGIGKNFMNPALGARAFMMASWAGFMTTWTAPHANLPLFGNVTVTDAISTATPLATLKTDSAPVTKITIVPRTSGALGYTMQVDEGEHNLMSKDELLNKVATLTGGRAAEELIFGSITTGASNDIEQATKLTRSMITRYGMSRKFDMVALETVTNQYLSGDTALACSAETAAKIDEEVIATVKTAHEKAIGILQNNMDALHRLAHGSAGM